VRAEWKVTSPPPPPAIDDFDGDQVFLRDGYTAVVDDVAKDLVAAELIQLGAEVQQIDWSAKPIRVQTSRDVYTADQVVCTLPLGVLQHPTPIQNSPSHSDLSLFCPALPADKHESIQSLGFGTLDKILLVYEKSWWTEEPYISIWKHALVDRPLDANGGEDGGFLEDGISSWE
jgi:monoamine oxidase